MKSKVILALFVSSFLFCINAQNSKEVKYMSDKDTVLGYLSLPSGEGKHPAILLIHEWWGITDWMKGNADMFAKKGYVALVVDLFRGKVTNKPDEAMKLVSAMNKEQGVKDVITAYNYLKTLPEVNTNKIGSIGWCFGGAYSLQSAINIPELKAVVICYGQLTDDQNAIEKIKAPLLAIYGKEDKNIPPDVVDKFEKSAKKLGKKIKVFEYPGSGHAFMNSTGTAYNKEETPKAWKEINTFFDSHLMTKL
jgi:carboxymethylenebutenolidase